MGLSDDLIIKQAYYGDKGYPNFTYISINNNTITIEDPFKEKYHFSLGEGILRDITFDCSKNKEIKIDIHLIQWISQIIDCFNQGFMNPNGSKENELFIKNNNLR